MSEDRVRGLGLGLRPCRSCGYVKGEHARYCTSNTQRGDRWCQSCDSASLDVHTLGCPARDTNSATKPSAGGILKDVKLSRFGPMISTFNQERADRYQRSLEEAYGRREPGNRNAVAMAPASEDAIKPIEGKVRFELIPVRSLETVARVLTHGAAIRGDNNWQKGQSWSRYIGAALRHIYAFMRGEDNDIETSEPHLAHAVCCCLFLLEYMHTHRAKDDRGKIL